MKSHRLAATFAALTTFAIAKNAAADPSQWEVRRRVAVLSNDWEVAARVRRLLTGVSLDAQISAEEAPCEPTRVKRAGAAAFASSVVCMDAAGIEVWTLDDGHAFEKRERMAWASTPPTIRDEAIVQATEVVRANVASMAPLPPEPSPPPRSHLLAAPSEPVPSAAPPPPSPSAVEPDKPSAPAILPTQVEPRKTVPFIVGAGPAVMTSNGYNPAWGAALDAELGVWSNVAIAVNAMLPLTTARLGYPNEQAGGRSMSIGAGVVVPLVAADSLIVPRLGAGAGLVWLHTEPLYTFSNAAGHEQDFYLPQFYADAAVSLRLYGRARLVLAQTIAATTSQVVIRVNDSEQGRFGWPIAMTQLRFEAQL